MNTFDTRLLNNLFPETPASFEKSVHKALKKAGVEKTSVKPWKIVSIAVAASAVAASFMLVLLSAFRGTPSNELAPGASAQAISTPLPRASEEPEWNTPILAAVSEDSRYTQEDADRCGRAILSFLREIGESEPDELWIIRMKSTESFLPADDTGSYTSCVLVLARSRFDATDGPNLYCVQNQADGKVLWGTIDGSPGPHRVLAEVYGQKRWMVFGSNTESGGEHLGHIVAGYLTGGEPGTDVEFSAILSAEQERTPFNGSKHLDQLLEYYLVSDGASDPASILNLSLLLVTSTSSYAFPIRDTVSEVQALTAEGAAAIRRKTDALTQPRPTPTPNAGTLVTNLTDLSDGDISYYADAILKCLESSGTAPKTLWICGVHVFGSDQPHPSGARPTGDAAYVLAQYTFEGETGPELFLVQNGSVRWQTSGYDPFRINAVYDPINEQNVAFGASYAYSNGPVAAKEGKIVIAPEGAANASQYQWLSFPMQLPLNEVQARIAGQSYADARESFICPYPKNMQIYGLVFFGTDDHYYKPSDDETVNMLAVSQVAPQQ